MVLFLTRILSRAAGKILAVSFRFGVQGTGCGVPGCGKHGVWWKAPDLMENTGPGVRKKKHNNACKPIPSLSVALDEIPTYEPSEIATPKSLKLIRGT